LEPLFYKYGILNIYIFTIPFYLHKLGVDIELWAHEHEYQRLWPVYNRVVYKGSEEEPYVDPKAPVHFITGSAVSV